MSAPKAVQFFLGQAGSGKKENASLCAVLYFKMIILPRQARDKHRESTLKETRFLIGAPVHFHCDAWNTIAHGIRVSTKT